MLGCMAWVCVCVCVCGWIEMEMGTKGTREQGDGWSSGCARVGVVLAW